MLVFDVDNKNFKENQMRVKQWKKNYIVTEI